MIKKRVIPEIRFPIFTENWKPSELSTLMDFSNGINAPKENYGKGRKMISVMDILSEEPILYNNIRSSVEVSTKEENSNKVESGDIVFVRSSEVRNEVGWAKGYLEKEFSLYSGFTIRGKKTFDFDALFLELSINGKSRKQIESKAGGSTRFNVTQSILKSVIIMEPSLLEQNKISAFFKMLDDMIMLQQQLLNDHKQLKKAMLQKMFPQKGETVPKIRFSGFTDDWKQKEMGELTEIKTGKKDVQDATIDGAYPFYIRSDEIKRINTYSFDGEAILIPGEGRLGEIFHYINGKFDFHQRVYKISDFTDVSALFLLYFMKLKFKRHAMKYTVKATVDSLRLPMIKEFEVIVPNIDEQKKIGNFFKQLDETVILYEKKLETYQELKKAMLQKMFV